MKLTTPFRLVAQKLLLLLLIIIVPGGLLLALSMLIYRRSRDAALMEPTLEWTPAILRSNASPSITGGTASAQSRRHRRSLLAGEWMS